MKTGASLKNRQGGAVAVMVGISIVLLVGFLAMVIDLGHLYIAKTGLQNAADAAALAGAKELDQTSDGVERAKDMAIRMVDPSGALGNRVNKFFGNLGQQQVTLTSDNVWFSSTPYPTSGWKSYAEAYANPAGLTFIKVDTASGNLQPMFAVVWNIMNMATGGTAVAGSFETAIAPIGVCAIDPANERKFVPNDTNGYLFEYGFQRGVSYDISKVNGWKFGLTSGTELYLHPTATDAATCQPEQGNADFITPFLCTGKSAISGSRGSNVYANTGLASNKAISAINTRFDQYGPPLDPSLDYKACPPDANIKGFGPSLAADNGAPGSMQAGWMRDKDGNLFNGPTGVPFIDPNDTAAIPRLAGWLADLSTPPGYSRTTANFNQIQNDRESNQTNGGCSGSNQPSNPDYSNCSNNYGVLWSYTRPIDDRNATALRRPSPTDWQTLYPSGPTPTGYFTGACSSDPDIWYRCPSPYQAGLDNPVSSNPYYQAPSHTGQRDRRVLNMVIIKCPGTAPGQCAPLEVLGVGRFFLQTSAIGARTIFAEFDGLLQQSFSPSDIRLY